MVAPEAFRFTSRDREELTIAPSYETANWGCAAAGLILVVVLVAKDLPNATTSDLQQTGFDAW